jgi:uncharacterized protein (TIGR03084 family)
MTTLDELVRDLRYEGALLRTAIDGLPEADWYAPTAATDWQVATQVAHLAWTDELAITAMRDPAAFEAILARYASEGPVMVDIAAERIAELTQAEVLDRWDRGRQTLAAALLAWPAGVRIPWLGPDMSAMSMASARLMETWAHGHDIYGALGDQPAPSDRLRHIAHLGVRTRDFAFTLHGLTPPAAEFRVELTSPSGVAWSWGPPDAAGRVSGTALDFCLLVTQRIHRGDTRLVTVGPEAEMWLAIAQAFAGNPGPGRRRTGTIELP